MSQRLFDLGLAVLGLALAWPLFLLVAVLVKLDSRGPVFFRQERVGRHGRPFRIVKFRTMVDHAAALGPRLTQKRDPRVTRIGQILRWLKIDELPQLLNVLRGEMSIVGPRPEDPHFVGFYTEEQRQVLSVRPGILGLSQTFGRDELEKFPDGPVDAERYYVERILPEKLATDLAYVRTRSLRGDLMLVVAGVAVTVLGAFKGRFLRENRRRIRLLAADTAAGLLVYHAASVIKLGAPYAARDLQDVVVVSALILLVRPPLFVYFGLCQNILRYLGISEFLAITRAVTVGSVVIVALTFMLGFQGHSRLVFLLDWGLLILVLFGARVGRKAWAERARRSPRPRARNVLIVGADDTGARLVDAMNRDPGRPHRAIGFLDDDPAKQGATIHGIPVLGRVRDLGRVAAEAVDVVVILFPHVAAEALPALIEGCRARNLEYRFVPTLDRLLEGDVFLPEFDHPALRGLLNLAAAPARAPGERDRGAARANGARPGGGAGRALRPRRDRPVLVTGGAGYVGAHVVGRLLAQERRVRVLDRFLYGDAGLAPFAGHPRLEVVEGDVRHLGTMAAAARDVDGVIALAALVGDAACELDPDETVSTNLEATRLLAEVCRRAAVRRLVFASSCSVYGANGELLLNEGSWLNPTSLYARTRLRSEECLLRRKHQLGVTVLRLATVFGLSARMRLDLVVNTFTAHGYFDRTIRVLGGRQYRPHVHVQDAADAFLLALDAEDARVRGEIFNVGDDRLNTTVLDVARLVQAALPDVAVQVSEAARDDRDYRVTFDKIRHLLGFRARWTLEAGIAEMLDAFRRGAVSGPRADVYHNLRWLQARGFRGRRAGAPAAGVA